MMAIQQIDLMYILEEFSRLASEELVKLCNTESNIKYDELVSKTEKIASLEVKRDMVLASLRSIAESNLSKQQDYESAKSKLLTCVCDNNRLKSDIEQKASKAEDLTRKASLKSILLLVEGVAAQAEQESENIAQSFLSSATNYTSFIDQYLDKRKLAHIRRIKAERLRQESEQSWTGFRTQSSGHRCH